MSNKKYKIGQTLVRPRLDGAYNINEKYVGFQTWAGQEKLGDVRSIRQRTLGNDDFRIVKILGSKTAGMDFFLYDKANDKTILLGHFVLNEFFKIKAFVYRKIWVSCSK